SDVGPARPAAPPAPLDAGAANPDAAPARPDAAPAKAEADPGQLLRLGDLKKKLAAFGDPPPPAACPAEASIAAAELVLQAREAVAADAARAAQLAAQAIDKCPSFAAAHNVHGNALQKAEKFDDAADAYARALTFAPDYESPRFNLGVMQLRRHDSAAI